MYIPGINPETVATGSAVELKDGIFGPEETLQSPVLGGVGVFPARVVEVAGLQSSWSGPASAWLGIEFMVTVTSAKLTGQVPFVIVQRNP